MFDVKTRLIKDGKHVGYRLTDRIEDIQVTKKQFAELVEVGLVYSVVHSRYPDRILGIKGLNLDTVTEESIDNVPNDIDYTYPIRIKHRVVKYKTYKLIEMLNYKHLDYVQKKYFVGRFIKVSNKDMLKDIVALEKLAGKYNDEKCVDIKPFLEKFKDKYEILGYYVENTSKDTYLVRESHKKKFKRIPPGREMYLSNKEMAVLCRTYKLDKNKMLTRAEDVLLSIERTSPNKLIEQLHKGDRKQVANEVYILREKERLAQSILRKEDFDKIAF